MAAIGAVLIFALEVPQGYSALTEKQRQIRALEMKNAELASEIEKKRRRIRELETNRAVQELEIRQHLKKLREGEYSFILQEQKK